MPSYFEANLETAEAFSFGTAEAVAFTHGRPGGDGMNQDAVGVHGNKAGRVLLAVADGVGGSRSGAKAARMVLEEVETVWNSAPEDVQLVRAALISGIEKVNQKLVQLGSGLATTLAVVLIEKDVAKLIHVGDSSILVVGQRGRIKHQNISHGPVGYGLEAGLINETEAMKHEERHVVSNVVGSSDMRIEVGPSIRLAPHDTVFVASDGVTDNLYLSEIVTLVRKGPLTTAASALVVACNQRMNPPQSYGSEIPCKPDDVSFILLRKGRNAG